MIPIPASISHLALESLFHHPPPHPSFNLKE